MSLPAGKLRHRIRIERLLRYIDTHGDTMEEWTEVTTVWAAIEPLSVREFTAAQAVQSQTTAKIVIRHRPGLLPTDRIVGVCGCHEGRIFNPAGFLADKDSGIEYLTIPVSEGVNNG